MAAFDTPAPAFEVNVVRSNRRKKSVAATLNENLLTVTVPAWMRQPEIDTWVAEMARRFGREARSREVDLADRAAGLAAKYDLPVPASIRWVDNMASRWASCTIDDRAIRVSRRLAQYPAWVLDSVIVHELCHLVVPNHSAEFRALMERYPLHERATGYLIAKAQERDQTPPVPENPEAAPPAACVRGGTELRLF